MTTTTVASTAALESALSSAQAGDTILLAPGTYTNVSAQNLNFSSAVTIASQSASDPAILTGLGVSGSNGLTFSNLDIIGTGQSVYWYASVSNSSNISFSNMLVEGSDPNNQNDAGGITIMSSTHISVTDSVFKQLNGVGGLNALNFGGDNFVTVTGSSFSNLGCDGIDSFGTSNITISNNLLTDFMPAGDGHPDAIQFWTENSSASAQNIVISNNTISRGSGGAVQGIFVTDDSYVLPYLNLQITGNTLTGTLYNGIVVSGSVGANISHNIIQSYTDLESWILTAYSTNPTISNNQAQDFVNESTDSGIIQSNNVILAPIPVPTSGTPVTSTGTVTVGGSATPTAPAAPTGLALDPSTNSGPAGENLTNIAKVQIDGTAADGATVTLYDGSTAIGSAVANATTGAFSIVAASALANGTHTLTATATNSSGQTSAASAALSVVVDTQPATAALTQVSQTSHSLTLSGTATDAVSSVPFTVAILQDGTQIGTATPANGTWSFSVSNISNAVHAYTLETSDAAGNTAPGVDTLIVGTSGHDTIVGGPGANLIFGGAGADTITGGPGTNTFIYNNISDAPLPTSKHPAVETITNWVSGSDHLNLTGLGPMTFGGQTSVVTPHSVEWYVSGGNTYVVGDVLGHNHADFMIELVGVHNLSSSDFIHA